MLKRFKEEPLKQAERIIACLIWVVLENFFVFFALR